MGREMQFWQVKPGEIVVGPNKRPAIKTLAGKCLYLDSGARDEFHHRQDVVVYPKIELSQIEYLFAPISAVANPDAEHKEGGVTMSDKGRVGYLNERSRVDEMLCLTPEQIKAEMEAAYELAHLAALAYERATRRWQTVNRWCVACRWWIQDEDGCDRCFCEKSPFFLDLVEDEHTCEHWERDDEND